MPCTRICRTHTSTPAVDVRYGAPGAVAAAGDAPCAARATLPARCGLRPQGTRLSQRHRQHHLPPVPHVHCHHQHERRPQRAHLCGPGLRTAPRCPASTTPHAPQASAGAQPALETRHDGCQRCCRVPPRPTRRDRAACTLPVPAAVPVPRIRATPQPALRHLSLGPPWPPWAPRVRCATFYGWWRRHMARVGRQVPPWLAIGGACATVIVARGRKSRSWLCGRVPAVSHTKLSCHTPLLVRTGSSPQPTPTQHVGAHVLFSQHRGCVARGSCWRVRRRRGVGRVRRATSAARARRRPPHLAQARRQWE